MLIEGALIAVVGVLVGRFLPSRRRPEQPKAPEAVCGCTHGFHTHDPQSGECQATVKAYRFDNLRGREVFDKYVPCACVRYTGPTPLPEFFAPEIGAGS